ncbi:MAG: glycosyltransferase [Thermodesulfovibrionales bacterium]|nr:glycosyltransferase [Thermodesulfovibrionales bacterium]
MDSTKGKTLNALFITHDVGNYGASRSLQLLLKNYKGINIDLIIKKELRRKNDLLSIRERFGKEIRTIREYYLPFAFCYKYKPDFTLKILVYKTIMELLWHFNKRNLYSVIRKGHYDYIYLNSLVLHPIITDDMPFVIHVRDIFDKSSQKAVASIKKAMAVIFIDEATKEPFSDTVLRNSIVLNNPFDMKPIEQYVREEVVKAGVNFQENTIFSLIGQVTEKKGVGFIIKSFMKASNKNARLLIVGGGDKKFIDEYKIMAKDDQRIIFWGEESDILKIYAVSDYVLRGESYQCIGRTIYEGLYSGCRVIIPGDKNNMESIFEYDKFKDSIYFYTPRSNNELQNLFEELSDEKVGARTFRSNVDGYVRRFHEFVIEQLQAWETR